MVISLFVLGCHQKKEAGSARVVIKEKKGQYTLYRNGKPYFIKGAAGSTNFKALKMAGGNTMRIWDTVGLAKILDSAAANQLAVIVGLPIANSDVSSLYNDSANVAKQFDAFKGIVNRYKSHPAVLMWCIGNELDFPYKLSYRNFYKAFNQLTDMIHQDDPDHPVTTTLLNFNKKYIFNIQVRCNIDVISFNIFSNVNSLRDDLKHAFFWNGPFLLMEWGINGPWEGTEQTAWGAYIEKNSREKAASYAERYRKYIPLENSRLLGTFIFYWGSKQESTPTWFSMFDERGAKSEAVEMMSALWIGKPYKSTFPQIDHLLLDNKRVEHHVLVAPGTKVNAELKMIGRNSAVSIKWEVFKEDWFKVNNLHSSKKMRPLLRIIHENQAYYGKSLAFKFISPIKEGPYRLFATVYDGNGRFATCNFPFYVIADQ